MGETDRRAVIVDLDGVVTRTAAQHARAWKQMFDQFLEQRSQRPGEDLSPFEIERDYTRYIDGKPRFDGVRSFLESRAIKLPESDAADSPETHTVRELGQRKNEIFLELLDGESVEIFDDAVEQLRRWRRGGVPTALITSSRNGRRILELSGLGELFDVTVDGIDAERLAIRGKPAPDIFLHAARELGAEPRDVIVVEDAIAGVQAARAGGFSLVVGVARDGDDAQREALLENGADIVVTDLRDLNDAPGADPTRADSKPLSALEHIDRIVDRLDEEQAALCFDYDGTLTPIVQHPEDAVLSEDMQSLLRELAGRVTVAIVSGRDLSDVQQMVALDNLYYAGSHGFDVAGPQDVRMQLDGARELLPELDAAERELHERVQEIDGAWVERKRFAIAVHYREADESAAEVIASAVDASVDAHPQLRKTRGKKIFELQPDIPWDKGRAVRWLLDTLGLGGPEVLPIYVGDNTTDEDAFRALSGHGVGIRVGSPDKPTHAGFYLRNTDELERFGRELLTRLDRRQGNHG